MILLVSTFFIGLGSLVDRAGAKFKSDAKALELIRQARIAIGGDANINNVRSMSIAGTSTHFFDKEGVQQTEQGSLEINLQIPNQFNKMVRIGNPDGNGGDVQQKRIEVIVTRDANGNVLTEDVRGSEPTWTDEKGNNLKLDGNKKFIIKKDDGTVQEINSGDTKTFVFKSDGGDTQTWNTEDGKKIIIDKAVKTENIYGERNNELFRTTLALLLTAPQGLDVTYTFAGEGNVDGNACNIVEARTGGSSFKLFLDKSTFLPRMMSYQGSELPNIVKIKKDDLKNASKEEIIELKIGAGNMNSVEHQLKFSDFRSVGGLLLPHRWTEIVGDKQTQNIDIANYEVNPANIADKFKGQKVFIRKIKDQ